MVQITIQMILETCMKGTTHIYLYELLLYKKIKRRRKQYTNTNTITNTNTNTSTKYNNKDLCN